MNPLPGSDHETPDLSRRTFIQAAGAGAATLALWHEVPAAPAVPAPAKLHAPLPNRAPLAAQPYALLPTGSVKPAGWLLRQLQIQAAGMGGRLDEIWPDVGANSGWLGGTGEAWERGPYFLDGLLPLAWLLDCASLKAKAQKYIDWTLSNPWPDGMIGPRSNNDWWPRMVMLKVLTQYHELTEDPRVIPVMTGYFQHQLQALPQRPLTEWGRFRWQDELVSVIWLYNRTGSPDLLELARLLQAQGWNWRGAFEDFPFKERVTKLDMVRHSYNAPREASADRFMFSHGVNNAMGLKASPVWSLVSGSEADRTAVHEQLATLDKYHGLTIGLFSADEHFAGRSPSQGIELCAVVEALYSLEHALAITGDPVLADRIERIAYNALPATFTEDMWAHQYDQQPNQIECSLSEGPWATNGPDANLFGLEPNFGCCTANFHQGWPKLTASLWMASAEGGLAAMIYAPCEVATVIGDVPLRIREITDYPFRDRVHVIVEPERTITFPMKLRLPGWARGASCNVNGRLVPHTAKNGFAVIERSWRKGDRVDIAFDFETRAVPEFNQAVSVEHGPLLFSLPIGERWEKLRDHGPSADWEVYPTSAWNFGIEESSGFQRSEHAISPIPFSRESPPVSVTVNARSVPQWTTNTSFAPPPPQSPVVLTSGTSKVVTLIPYGTAKLRITSFPSVKDGTAVASPGLNCTSQDDRAG